MSVSNDDAVSQSSKKHKAKKRSFFSRSFLRGSFYRKKSRSKSEEVNDVSLNAFAGTSSLSGDSRSVSMSSKGDALTVVSAQSEVAGAAAVKSDLKSVIEGSGEQASYECPLCLTTRSSDHFPKLMTCPHRSCLDCLQQYLTIEITESRVNLMCPECHERLHPVDMRNILKSSPHLIDKWEEFTLRRCLSVDPDCRWCPAPDCGYAVIAYGCASCPKLHCERPGCNTDFCYHCRQEWHPNQSCDAAHLQRRKELRIQSDSLTYSQGSNINDYIKPCPKCGALIAKMNDGSCNHMTCTVCEAEFCWLCLQEITDLHYLSPSGCTFWGKKPWSRKKKLLWQLGLLIGAPLGIGLVAVVAIPAIIIGLPIWVARRVIAHFQKKSNSSKHKRNTTVVMCVMISILVSPILAALAVGVGVPVMLLYVYGVVPFSLCRTGSYGITARTAANRARNAMRIDIGSPVIPAPSVNMPEPATNSGGVAHLITNPSIGEASVGGMTMASLSLSHASMDPVERDGDSASTTAIAGASITGSLSGSVAANAVLHGRKDADQHSTHTQASIASGNYTSVQVHMTDTVSENSIASHLQVSSGNVTKSYSSKSMGAKRKTSKSKITGSRKSTVPKKIHEHDENKVLPDDKRSNIPQPSIDASQNKINLLESDIERAVPTFNDVLTKNEDATSTGSEASSCGSQHALLSEGDRNFNPSTSIEICNEKRPADHKN